MADIKISELTQAESLSLSDLMESAVPYNGGFLSRRMSIAQLANYLENYVQHTALSTTAKSIIGAINEIVGDLDDYYTKQETYSKSDVDTLIAGVSGLHFLVVSQLPVSDIDVNTIYLVPKQDVGTQDIYDEFIYIVEEAPTPSHWEKIGTTEIDLSDYVTDTELTTILNDYVTSSGLSTILASYATTSAMTTALADKVDKVSGKGLSTEDYTTSEKMKLNGIESGAQVNTVTGVKGDDENTYRTGDVNITKDNIGLGSVPNVATNDQTPTFSEAGTRANIASGEKLSVIMGKIKKFFSDLKTVAFTGSYNDLTDKPSIPSGQVQSDWSQTNTSEVDYIKNKPQNLVSDASYVHTDNNYTSTEKSKLSGIAENAEVNVQSDWNVTSSSSDAFIKNKPTIPTKTSQLTNDSNFPVDANYVHTDVNFTSALKSKLDGIAQNAEVNVQSDWNVTNSSSDAFIKNKPSIPTKTSDLNNDSNFVADANYVHTDVNFTSTLKSKLDGIAQNAEVNVQSDWNVTSTSSDAFIKNKPSIPTALSDLSDDATHRVVTDTQISTWNNKAGSDVNVTQTLVSTNKNYPLLFSIRETSDTQASRTGTAQRNNSIYVNPSTGNLQTTKINEVEVGSSPKFTDTTYTFTGGTNKFSVSVNGGTPSDVNITPSISNNITGSGTRTNGYLAKFSAQNTITNGPQIGSDTTKFLRNDGSWEVPSGSVTGVKGNSESTYRTGNVNLTSANIGALALTGGVVTGNVTIRKDLVEGDTDAPALLQLQARYTPTGGSQVNSTASLRAYSDHGAGSGANLVIHPGGNLFIGSGEAPNAHYNLYPNSGSEITFITADSVVNIQANGGAIANRKGLKITTGGEIVPNVADVATNDTGSIGTSTCKWANIYATNLNGVAIGDDPKFTDTNTKVTQTNDTSNNKAYRVLFSNSNDNTTKADTARKNPYLLYNPSGNLLQVGDDSHYGYVTSTYFTARNGLQAGTYVSIGDPSSNIVVLEKDSGVSGSVAVTSPTVSGKLAITDDFKWKKLNSYQGDSGKKLVLPANATELQFVIFMPIAPSTTSAMNITITVPTSAITYSESGTNNPTVYQSLRQGYYYATTAFATVNMWVWLRTNDGYIYCKLKEVYQNNTTNAAGNTSYDVYYR